MGLKEEHARMFSSGNIFGSFFESVLESIGDNADLVRLSTNYIAADLAGLVDAEAAITINPTDFADLMKMTSEGLFRPRGAKDILKIMVDGGGAPADIAEKQGLLQQSDERALGAIVDEIILANPKVVADYKSGKDNLLQFLWTGDEGKQRFANPALLQKLFKEKLG